MMEASNIDLRRNVVVAVTASGTLYVAVPRGNARYRTRRCRVDGRPDARQAELDGVLLSVEPVKLPVREDAEVVRCGGALFVPVAGTYGMPRPELRMAVGGDARGVTEVTSTVSRVDVMDIDRTWVIEPMLRAFRNGDRRWREMLRELPYEQGCEHIEDDSGSLAAEALERFYRARLREKGIARTESARRRGLQIEPRILPVSNEDLPAALDRVPGEGMAELPATLGDGVLRHRGRIASGIDRMLATVRRWNTPARQQVREAA